MKIQGVTVIFCLLIVPIVLILTYFIQKQVDTIALQTAYDTKLLDATHDAMAAFEINTANENLSSVADSLRSIIMASNNVFINSLSSNLGMSNASQNMIKPYIPAVLYTLYDGYYIYSPTRIPEVLTNSKGQAVTVEDNSGVTLGAKTTTGAITYNKYNYTEIPEPAEGETSPSVPVGNSADVSSDYGQILYVLKDGGYTTETDDSIVKYKLDYVLKSYMPYAIRYVKKDASSSTDIDIVINYTLDNFITITGNINGVYYSKSGYLIKNDLVKEVKSSTGENILNRSYDSIDNLVNTYVNSGNQIEITLNSTYQGSNQEIKLICNNGSSSEVIAATKYYIKSKIFSNWVYTNLGNLKENDISKSVIERENELYTNVQDLGDYNVIYDFSSSDRKIFDSTQNPENGDSTFANHKTAVIRNSIQYNLNIAMSSYNQMSSHNFAFNMPIISDDEWDKITSNVTIVSFMQGFSCGLKTYNGYAIVPSSNNELTVIPEEIFYVANVDENQALNNEEAVYHRIDCLDFNYDETLGASSFRSKETKYDKIYNKADGIYEYDHKNIACYKCIVNGNYLKNYYNGTDFVQTYSDKIDLNSITPAKQLLYYTAVGKERVNIYKTNAIILSTGYEVSESYNGTYTSIANINLPLKDKLENVKEIKVTVSNVKSGNPLTQISKFKAVVNGREVNNDIFINANQIKAQTISVNIDTFEFTGNSIQLVLEKLEPSTEDIRFNVESVRVIYK